MKSVGRSSKIAKFAPYLDDQGVMRVGDHLQDTCLPVETKHAILLGSRHLATLLLQFLHVSQMHQGVEHALGIARKYYWVLGGRRLQRSIAEKCVVRRRYRAQVATEGSPPPTRESRETLLSVQRSATSDQFHIQPKTRICSHLVPSQCTAKTVQSRGAALAE